MALTLSVCVVLVTACTTETENPTCGEGLIQTDAGCVPDFSKLCGPGTVFNGTDCVVDAEVVGGEDTSDEDSATSDVSTTEPPLEDVPTIGPELPDDVACVPSCEGKVCGDDGCGGTCGPNGGACTSGECNALGRCVPAGWTCADFAYGEGASCDCGCGVHDPDCDLDPAPPTFGCVGTQACDDGDCVACEPQCGAGVECGPDGCGGSCGRCWDPEKPMCVEGTCTDKCEPQCPGYECGPDGCGGVCGVCAAGEFCVVSDCVTLPPALSCVGNCGDSAPGGCSCTSSCSGSACCGDKSAACACDRQCDGKSCGPDGCGGTCGSCDGGELCESGVCVDDRCDPDPCQGRGTCDDGACSCQVGFAGATCGECAASYIGFPTCRADPCLGVNCGAGTCDSTNGTCVCDPGVAGGYCDRCASPERVWPECLAPDCSTGPDTDSDGVRDSCDACPEDGDLATFNWVTWNTPVTGNTATGTVGGTTVTYTSDRPLQTDPDFDRYDEYFGQVPEFRVPNTAPVLKNTEVTTNTLTFGRAIANPLLVFASIGTAGLKVPIEFSADIEILWSLGVTRSSPRVIRGEEGYAIVRIKGVHESITFRYTVAENWGNFVFGFGGGEGDPVGDSDSDGDGILDICDTDLSDNVGCSDGGREGFVSQTTYPDIAACAGGWKVPGLVTISSGTIADQVDRCGNLAGDDSPNPTGNGCTGEDLCAVGWSVCANQATVAAKAGGNSACGDLGTSVAAPYLFATRQRSQGNYACDISLDPRGANDVYGCGSSNFGFPLSNCGPLNRVTDDNCVNVATGTAWACNDNDLSDLGSIRELADVTKPSAANGGVLCCRN